MMLYGLAPLVLALSIGDARAVAADLSVQARDAPVNNIDIRIGPEFKVISGETTMGKAGTHPGGDDVLVEGRVRPQITIGGLGKLEKPTGSSVEAPITQQE